MQSNEAVVETNDEHTFVEGIDFYFENGLMVLTRNYLLNRGICCENKCRHCPYKPDGAERSHSRNISNSSSSVSFSKKPSSISAS